MVVRIRGHKGAGGTSSLRSSVLREDGHRDDIADHGEQPGQTMGADRNQMALF